MYSSANFLYSLCTSDFHSHYILQSVFKKLPHLNIKTNYICSCMKLANHMISGFNIQNRNTRTHPLQIVSSIPCTAVHPITLFQYFYYVCLFYLRDLLRNNLVVPACEKQIISAPILKSPSAFWAELKFFLRLKSTVPTPFESAFVF